MKKNKLLGMVLIISALLLQVGYAQTIAIASEAGTANVDGYHVQFNEVTYEASKYVTVDAVPTNNGRSVAINVSNLYPGANFTLTSNIQNQGTKPIKIIGVKVLPTNMEGKDDFILNGYDIANNVVVGGIEGYSTYLTNQYLNQQLLINQIIPLTLKMEMKEVATELQSQSVGFELQVNFEQLAEIGQTGGGSTTPVYGNIPDEIVPGGKINIPDEIIPDGETNIPDEIVPGGGVLPKTGGVAAIIVYIIGITMLGSGVMLYRKKEKKII